jgi:uncharacterized membrane protein
MIHSAVIWDLAGTVGLLPAWWPPVSWYLIGAGIATACVAALLGILSGRRGRHRADAGPASAEAAAARRPGPRIGMQLLAIGVLLAAWLLRGHAEIPPDAPIVAAEVASAALYAFASRRRGPRA